MSTMNWGLAFPRAIILRATISFLFLMALLLVFVSYFLVLARSLDRNLMYPRYVAAASSLLVISWRRSKPAGVWISVNLSRKVGTWSTYDSSVSGSERSRPSKSRRRTKWMWVKPNFSEIFLRVCPYIQTSRSDTPSKSIWY